jgi:hypothetical protein
MPSPQSVARLSPPLDERKNRRMVSPMSRYEFLPPGWSSTYSFAIGWDGPLSTYFGQVIDSSISDDDDRVIVWAGAMPPYYSDLDKMMCAVNDGITGKLPAITLATAMRAQLIKDKKRSSQASRRRDRKPGNKEPVFALDLFPDYKPTGE